jgi:GT2 family glycosyltransferase
MPKSGSMISIIICSISRDKFTAVSENFALLLGDAQFEIIGIHDAKSLCEGYNRGIAQSSGDILIFCHDDIEIITPDFHSRLCRHLKKFDVIGCVGTTRLINSAWVQAGDPYIHGMVAYPVADVWPGNRFNLHVWGGIEPVIVENIQSLDGLFFAVNRRVVEAVNFDEQTFDGFHVYDADFTFAAYLAGFSLAVCKDILIAHKSPGVFDETYQIYEARFQHKYQDRLSLVRERNDYKIMLAKNVERAQMLRLCAQPKFR